MISDKLIQAFIELSRQIGARPDYVQGAGGNTSVKIDSQQMAVKASGVLLQDLTPQHGFSLVNFESIARRLKNTNLSEEAVTALIKEAVLNVKTRSALKPSMETGFHALLPYPYVVHSHSIYANLLTCSQEGKALSKMLFPTSSWVDYANPGKALIAKFAEVNCAERYPNIIFLANHGIFIAADTATEAYCLHETVTMTICDYFKIVPTFDVDNQPADLAFVKKHVLFPDQVVYLLDESLANTQAAKETLAAYHYLDEKIADLGLTKRYIPVSDVAVIANMENEKYRKSLVK
ncbi:MAG TPA: class II aldolase/adducin family protein [Gammaproteobacteria bacterium]|nr:class II aldolase/adducin family protein [Gammaproteobacteria bacterium]